MREPTAPTAYGAIPQVTVNAGKRVTVIACFNDPNQDLLTYSVQAAKPGLATTSISGTTITVSAIAPGNAPATVTVSDPGGLKAQQSFQVMVPNRPPLVQGAGGGEPSPRPGELASAQLQSAPIGTAKSPSPRDVVWSPSYSSTPMRKRSPAMRRRRFRPVKSWTRKSV